MKAKFGVAAVLAASLMFSAAAPGVSVAAESAAPPAKVQGPIQYALAHFADIEETEDPRFLEPCLDVLRGLRIVAAITGRIDAEMSFTYLSNGVLITKNVTVPLQSFELHPHETSSNPKVYEQVATQIDVGDDRVDRGQDITGTVRLVLVKGPKRTVVQQDTSVDVHID